MRLEMPLDIHAHERGELDEARIDAAERARIAHRHGRDQVLLEPFDRPRIGEFVDLGRIDAAIDRPRHQGHAARLRGVAGLRHHRGRDQHRHARLADRDHMGARPDLLQETDQVRDVFVEAEAAFRQRHVANVVPVGDEDVVLRQHGAHGAAQQRGEVARQRCDQQHPRLRGLDVLFEMQQRAERRGERGLLMHGHLAIADSHAIDAEGGPLVRQARTRDQLIGRRQVAQDGIIGDADQRPSDRLERGAGPRADRPHDVGMRLIELVKHSPVPGVHKRLLADARLSEKASAFFVAVRDTFFGHTGSRMGEA